MFVFIVSSNTTFRTPYSQLSSTTRPIHVVDDGRIYGVLKVMFALTINTDIDKRNGMTIPKII